jgi:hypothetical protein
MLGMVVKIACLGNEAPKLIEAIPAAACPRSF